MLGGDGHYFNVSLASLYVASSEVSRISDRHYVHKYQFLMVIGVDVLLESQALGFEFPFETHTFPSALASGVLRCHRLLVAK